jgi:ferrochelatase
MEYRTEPEHHHGQPARTAVLAVNLGTPDEPTEPALRRYLAEFLSDPRVVEIPRLAWLPLLYGVILRTRPARSAAKYASVWMDGGSPLAVWTARQAAALAERLAGRGHDVLVRHAMRYGRPAVPDALDALRREGATRILVLPLYPQYAAATTASVNDKVMQWAQRSRRMPEFRFIAEYHDDPGYIGALAARLRNHWSAQGRAQQLVLSFHGVPERSLLLGDPYHCQCHKTARLLARELELAPDAMLVTFQSRFGKAKWLEPYTEPTLIELARKGMRSVDVMCPGFTADCLETLEEIDQEARAAFTAAGGTDFRYVACLNADGAWIDALAGLAERHMLGWPTGTGAVAEETYRLNAQRDRALAMGAKD